MVEIYNDKICLVYKNFISLIEKLLEVFSAYKKIIKNKNNKKYL